MLVGPKIQCCAKPCKDIFLTSLLVWFCMVLQYSGLWSTQNEPCITIFILFRQCKGTQPFLFRGAWTWAPSLAEGVEEVRWLKLGETRTNYQQKIFTFSMLSHHHHTVIPSYTVTPWYAVDVQCTSTSNETCGALGFFRVCKAGSDERSNPQWWCQKLSFKRRPKMLWKGKEDELLK